mmetsp:Transcript_12456/g.17877  ORF Transcript_12456/g.17877 Transcript_12456/m.17877 type:complete len:848 (-) Transcript_12456:138-2681(-)
MMEDREMTDQTDDDGTTMEVEADNTRIKVEEEQAVFGEILLKHISNQEEKMMNTWEQKHQEDQAYLLNMLLNIVKKKKKGEFAGAFAAIFFRVDEDTVNQIYDQIYIDCKDAGLVSEGSDNRVTILTKGLDREYRGTFDLEQFNARINETFNWYSADHRKYVSPSFAIVQSSGMGKTKLMKQYKEQMQKEKGSSIDVVLLLCAHEGKALPDDYEDHFDGSLCVPKIEGRSADGDENTKKRMQENARNKVSQDLNAILSETSSNSVVLLFDEAHVLVESEEGGIYVSIRWWLRQKRTKHVVAVFAGTLLSLTNYQRVKAALGWTRDVIPNYVNYNKEESGSGSEANKMLYEPFYTFTTIAMEHLRVTENEQKEFSDELRDIRKCGYYGRPLFLAMLKPDKKGNIELKLLEEDVVISHGRGQIKNIRLYNILTRMLLSPSGEWAENDDSTASVLATRVQLGIASYDFVTKATSKGYANLVHFRGEGKTNSFGAASIAFPPDPVCAALAMGLMQESWSLSRAGNDNINGRDPSFWVQKAAKVFEQQMFLPNRGDAGEVFAALYMLLCGDELRKTKDVCMRQFEINLSSWLGSLEGSLVADADQTPAPADGKKRRTETKPRRSPRFSALEAEEADDEEGRQTDTVSDAQSLELKLNFIQVVRNYFRTHAWFSQGYLKYMYESAIACYVYPNCPAFDLVFPIRYGKVYHPALVSIRCWDVMGKADMRKAVKDMEKYVAGYRDAGCVTALCILIVIGSQEVKSPPPNKGDFPQEDGFVTVVVPRSDKFGVSEVIIKSATASVKAELLASHSFAHVEDQQYLALRASTRGEDQEFGEQLLADQQRLPTTESATL